MADAEELQENHDAEVYVKRRNANEVIVLVERDEVIFPCLKGMMVMTGKVQKFGRQI